MGRIARSAPAHSPWSWWGDRKACYNWFVWRCLFNRHNEDGQLSFRGFASTHPPLLGLWWWGKGRQWRCSLWWQDLLFRRSLSFCFQAWYICANACGCRRWWIVRRSVGCFQQWCWPSKGWYSCRQGLEAEHVIVSEMVHNRRTFHSCLVSMAEDCVKVRDRPVVGLLVPDYGASHPRGDCLGGVCGCVRCEPVKFEVEFDGFVPDIATDPVPWSNSFLHSIQ